MNKKMNRVLTALLAGALMLTACGQKETEETNTEAAGIAVQVQTVSRDTIYSANRVSGRVAADDAATIMVATTAKCTAVYAQAGDTVTAGQKLCTLDLAGTLANYNAAKISYNSTLNSYNDQKAVLDAQVALQQKTLDATKALFAIGAASQIEVDSADLQLQSAIATRDSSLAQMEAGVQQAKSGVEQLEMALENVDSAGNVVSPIDGVLVSMSAVEGGYVSSSMPVAVVDGMAEMKVAVSVSEAVVPKLNIGDEADIHVSSIDQTFVGTIRSVERSANMQTQLYTVTLNVPAEVEGLYSGMFADVSFRIDTSTDTIVIPTEAIQTSNGVQYVYVVEGETARYVEVETGLASSGVTEVVSGLNGGEQLVTVGQTYLSDGDPVRIVSGEG